MGAIKIRTMEDLAKVNAHLKVECLACGRASIWERKGMLSWFQHRGWNTNLEAAGTRFRCKGCGHRGAHLSAALAPSPPPSPPPVKLWEREAKERVRRARD